MLQGKAWKYGDDVDTDVIIPARYLTSSDPDALKDHCMEDLDPDFAKNAGPGDVIVAGSNFGCGSSREHAPISIKAAGVSCVIAKSFARIFFRNSFNIGLPILESSEAAENIDTGDQLEIDLATGLIKNVTKAVEYQARPIPDFMQELIEQGGLMPYVKKRQAAQTPSESGDAEAPAEKEEEAPKEPGARMIELEKESAPAGRDAPWVDEKEPEQANPEDTLEQGEEDDEDD